MLLLLKIAKEIYVISVLSEEDGYRRPVFGLLLMLSRHPVRVSCKSVSRPGNL